MSGSPVWPTVTLGDIAEVVGGLTKGQKRKPGERVRDVPYLRVANVQRGYLDLHELKTIEATDAEIERLRLRDGDILFTEGGDRDKLGRGWIWSGEVPECIHQNHIFRARLHSAEDQARFVSMYANTEGQAYFLDGAKQTTNLASINLTKLRALPLRLPPADEQRRIVEKIEALTAKSRRAKEALDAIPPLLERFRQSVLAAAFRGDLTKDWREQNPDVEPADQLLARIRRERRARWEQAELERLRAKGKVPKGDEWKKKYEPAAAPEFLNRPALLPHTWTWASVADVSECLDSMRVPVTRTDRRAGPYPYYGANGQVDSIDKYIYDEPLVLVTEDETFFGRTKPIAYRVSGKCWVNNHAHVLRPVPPFESAFLCMSLMHYPVIPWLSGTTGRAKLTQGALNRLPIALPPALEALEITRRVERSLRLEEVLVPELGAARSLLASLDAAILAKAFRGELDLLSDARRAAQGP